MQVILTNDDYKTIAAAFRANYNGEEIVGWATEKAREMLLKGFRKVDAKNEGIADMIREIGLDTGRPVPYDQLIEVMNKRQIAKFFDMLLSPAEGFVFREFVRNLQGGAQ